MAVLMIPMNREVHLKLLRHRQDWKKEQCILQISLAVRGIKLWKTGGSAAIKLGDMGRKILYRVYKIHVIRYLLK